MEKDKSIDVLNRLVEINNDRIEGYETASKETQEADLKALFSNLMKTSQQCRAELADEIKKLGGTPVEGTKTTGKFFRAWMDVKAAITGKDRKAIISSCEFGEDAILKAYQSALTQGILPAYIREILNNHLPILQAAHDKIKALRDKAASK